MATTEISEQERHEILSRAHTTIRLRETGTGDSRREMNFYGSFEIVADDGRVLYDLRLEKDGTLEIASGSYTQHGGQLLKDELAIYPCNGGRIKLKRSVDGGG
jgi:hypothetical protein